MKFKGNMAPTWTYFWWFLEAKLKPKSLKNLSWTYQEISYKIHTSWNPKKFILGRFWPPRWVPKRGPRNCFWRYFLVLGVSWGKDGPKTLPETSQVRVFVTLDPSRNLPKLIFLDFGSQIGGFWIPTWWILGPNFMDFASQFDGFPDLDH